VINSFRHRGLERFFTTGSKAGIQPKQSAALEEQLALLNAVKNPQQMNVPGYGWHALQDDPAGHYALWVTQDGRLTFTFEGEDAILVDCPDYHLRTPFDREEDMAMMHNPAHPGRILARYVEGHTVKQVAEHLGVPRAALSRILNGHAAISAEMAIRIGKVFDTDPEVWLRLQVQRDLWEASRKKVKAKPIRSAAA
jgi:proteic killer suppression protein